MRLPDLLAVGNPRLPGASSILSPPGERSVATPRAGEAGSVSTAPFGSCATFFLLRKLQVPCGRPFGE